VLIAGLGAGTLDAADAKAPALKTEPEKFNYVLGLQLGNMIKQQLGVQNIDQPDQFITGLNDALAGTDPKLPVADLQNIFRAGVERARAEASKVLAKEGNEFLAANAKKPGVKVTTSGLQYIVLKEGKGKTPKATDTVVAHYTGTLIDGTKFDSSVDRNEPLTIPANRVIPGWTEALTLMKEGAKWKVFIPWNLAYGAQGSPPKIPPYSALIFEMELIKVQ